MSETVLCFKYRCVYGKIAGNYATVCANTHAISRTLG